MIFGAITNSWREQLPLHSVKELVGQAVQKGAKHIELRQTCLGECEEGAGDDWRPNLERLQEVVQAYPGLTFDLAMALPYLTRKIDPQGDGFQAALAGAVGAHDVNLGEVARIHLELFLFRSRQRPVVRVPHRREHDPLAVWRIAGFGIVATGVGQPGELSGPLRRGVDVELRVVVPGVAAFLARCPEVKFLLLQHS